MGKKQKNKGEDSDIDALTAEIEGAGAAKDQGKGKGKKKKGKQKDEFDEDEILKEIEELTLESGGGKANKEPPKKSDSLEENEPVAPKEKKKTRGGKGKRTSLEEEEGDEEGTGAAGVGSDSASRDQKAVATAAPEAAPAAAAGDDEEEDDEGSRPWQKAKGGKKVNESSLRLGRGRGGRRGPKGGGGVGGGGGGGGVKAEEDEDDDSDEGVEVQKKAQKKQKGKGKAADSEEEEEEDTGTFKMKTAAQKKAEKKERDRKKKEEDRAKLKKKKEEEATTKKDEPAAAEAKVGEEVAEDKKLEKTVSEDQDAADAADAMGEEETEGDKKKKDKKKKKGEKEKEEKKKGPSKSAVKAMQEALKAMKDEEERIKQEEDERQRRMEEMETQRLEQEKLDQERKEKKKQKDKERKEKLKKEGKLLTKTQKEARARAEATLKALQAQGIEVPSKDSMPKKKPVYSDKRKKKPVVQAPEETSQVPSPAPETAQPITVKMEVETPKVEAVKEQKPEAADLDDWEAMLSDGEEKVPVEPKKVHIEVKETRQSQKTAAPEAQNGSEEDEDEEDDDEDEEDEEESDGAEEEEKKKPVTQSAKKVEKEPSSDSSSESDSDDGLSKEERLYEKAKRRIEKRKQDNLKNTDFDRLRAPVICVLGHVDTGKTKILDKLRHTNVQDGEAGGITQQIGATNVPLDAIIEQTKMVKNFDKDNIKIPGMLIIDTPGHESFSNLRNRGSSLCDIAILVVDIMHGLEPQTLESINLLKEKKCPFIVALNKIDRLYDWKRSPESDVAATLKKQKKNTKDEFDERAKAVIVEFAQQGLNAALYFENKDPRTFVSLVPTSAHSGDGCGNLIGLLVDLTQTMLARRLAHCDELRAQVMEVKALPGMGTTIDVILINGTLREGETIIVPGVEGPIVTQIRGLLLPPPLKELRVKNQYEKHKEVDTAQGVKILGKDLEKALAGLPLLVAHKDDEIPVLRDDLIRELKQTLSSIKLEEKGVYVQASTLGSLEALLEFLRTSKVPYSGINIGPVHKKDVMKSSTMLEHDQQYAVILAFDVKVERDSQEMADSLGVRIFSAEIIYHLFDAFTKYREDYKKQKQDEFKHIAVFPCKLRILPQFIFNSRDPIVMGVIVESGVVKQGTPVCVPTKGFVDIGIVTGIEINHKNVDSAKKGQEICVKIEPIPGESPKMFGRHFEATDFLVSKITRQSIDALKNWFRDEMTKNDWQLIMELKKTFEII
ncbi:LOW QUALITY PROTEIN: eukaryotic translation initiation factor 5B [Clupea harengus]|uniref:Eukaryotic translation initiation factor 5B n=1 Tax=Clupea harengus TaxID=7950 RepID=A0A6P3VMN3_CLUHA|nr:LOW QUALITY PROTEIN: eukaryotic translation initiation factor 5B [Clupea harengus]